MTPSRRLQAKGEVSTPQTGEDTKIMRRFINHPDLIIKMLSGNKKEIFSRFQLYAQLRPRHDGQSENGKLLPGTERETGKNG